MAQFTLAVTTQLIGATNEYFVFHSVGGRGLEQFIDVYTLDDDIALVERIPFEE